MNESPFDVAQYVRDYLLEAFNVCARPIARSLIAVGGLTVDHADGGLLIVAPARVFRATTPFPTEALNAPIDDDTDLLGVEFIVQVHQCVPALTEAGAVPSIEDQEAAHEALLLDSAVLWRALWSPEFLVDEWERSNIDMTFTEPLGGISAVEARFSLGLLQADWCLACTPSDEGPV